MVSETTFHALVGAVVTVVLSFVPFSPVLGGGVAAYLNDADGGEGLRIGALSGVIASIPLFLVGVLVVVALSVFAIVGPGHGPGAALGIAGLLLVLVVGGLFALLYAVGLSALGGYLGAYLVEET